MVVAVRIMLQWGRGLLTAETYGNHCAAIIEVVLQWGRGLLTAETRYVLPLDNVAAVKLQWGRGLLTAETEVVASDGTSYVIRFNGAAVF